MLIGYFPDDRYVAYLKITLESINWWIGKCMVSFQSERKEEFNAPRQGAQAQVQK